jgi:hypothetical protein
VNFAGENVGPTTVQPRTVATTAPAKIGQAIQSAGGGLVQGAKNIAGTVDRFFQDNVGNPIRALVTGRDQTPVAAPTPPASPLDSSVKLPQFNWANALPSKTDSGPSLALTNFDHALGQPTPAIAPTLNDDELKRRQLAGNP